MKFFPQFFRQYGLVLLVPFWTFFLLLPLSGAMNALAAGLAAGGVFALWRLAHAGIAGRAVRGAVGRFSFLRPQRDRAAAFLRTPATAGILLLICIIAPYFQNDYYRDVLTLTGMYVVLALGLNLIVGQAGLLNLGYVSFYAVGAYTYAILSTRFGVTFWPGLLAGGAAAAVFSGLIGIPTLRLRGDYFAIVTLGLGEITRILLNNLDSLTNGPNGISDIGRPVIGGFALTRPLHFYYLILIIAVLTIIAMSRIMASRIGRAWIAIREDETAAEAMGIDTFRLKLLAFMLGSAWAGVAGVFFAAKMAFVSPESFTFSESVMILCMVVLGGMGSIPGIILGAFLLIALPEFLREFQDYRMLAFGGALVLMMIFRPQGLLGTVKGR